MLDAKTFLLFLVFIHGMHVFVHGWNHKPRLENPEPRIRHRVLWLVAVVLWMTLHAASPAYYGVELVEHIGKAGADHSGETTSIEIARAEPAAEGARLHSADLPPASLQQPCGAQGDRDLHGSTRYRALLALTDASATKRGR